MTTLSGPMSRGAKLAVALFVVAALAAGWFVATLTFLIAIKHDLNEASPLTLYQYWWHFQGDARLMDWLALSLLAGGVVSGGLALSLLQFRSTKIKIFGDARFATSAEIRKSGLLSEKGIIVGRYGSRYLMFPGQQHAMISAPTRSGKGVGIVIPNLLNWPDSVVVLDIKQENWDITSGFRRRYGQECYLFNPAATDYRTHRYNPLAYISDDPNFRIDDVQKIANMLFPDVEGTDVIWTATPRALFLGLVLMLAETPGKPLTLGQVMRETLVEGDGQEYFARMINQRAEAGRPYTAACIRALNSYITIAAPNTRAGVMTSFRSKLELWMNPLLDAATCANDFDLRDIRKKRMSIYLGVTPDNLERMAPLLNLFFQQLIDLNTRELPSQNSALKHTCLLMMDEFTAIGKIGILAKGVSYVAGYNLRLLPIIQSPSQLIEVYGQDAAKTFLTNHALSIIYPPKATETETAKEISEWLGNQTVLATSTTKSRSVFKRNYADQSLQISEQSRALMLPQEIASLGDRRELVIMENTRPILAHKVRYYEDPVFLERLYLVSPHLRAQGRRVPRREDLDIAQRTGELAAQVPLIDLEAHLASTGAEGGSLRASLPNGGSTGGTVLDRPATIESAAASPSQPLHSFQADLAGLRPESQVANDKASMAAYVDRLTRDISMDV